MLVFNDRGAAGYIDVVLMEYPDHMQPLDEFLEKACMEGDKERIRKLLTEFCQMAVWLINDNLVHGAIHASNVMIDIVRCIWSITSTCRCRDRTLRITNRFGTPTT